MVRIKDPFDLFEIPPSRLNKREINHNSAKSVEEDIEDVKPPRDRGNRNRGYVGVDHEDNISCQIVKGKSFAAGVESKNFRWI
jgi:hypothetical protein